MNKILRKSTILIVLVFIVISGCTGSRNSDIVLNGNIEVIDAKLSFKIPGRLAERLVDEGDPIKAHQLIAQLDSSDQEILVAQAKANVALSEAVLDELMAGSRKEDITRTHEQVKLAKAKLEEVISGSRDQEIADAHAAVERAEAGLKAAESQLDLAKSDLESYEELFEKGVIAKRELDAVKTKFDLADSSLKESTARLESAKEMLSLRKEGARPEQIQQANANLKQAEAVYSMAIEGPRQETINQAQARLAIAYESLHQAEKTLEYTGLYAPSDGVVMSKSVEAGEYLNPGSPVVTIADLSIVFLRAYVNETDLGHVKLGANVEVFTDSFPDKTYPGIVSFISSQAEFTPKTVQTMEERVKLMYLVKIKLENPENELKAGMPANCIIKRGGQDAN